MKALQRIRSAFSYGVSSYDVLDIHMSLPKFTPDWHRLSQYQFVWVFLWGDTMTGMRSHQIVDGLKMYDGYTEEYFVMLKKALGKASYPVMFDPTPNIKADAVGRAVRAQVVGELYLLEPRLVVELDNHMQNTVEYQRRRTDIVVPWRARIKGDTYEKKQSFSELQFVRKRAWTYVADLDFYMNQSNYDARLEDSLLKTRPYNQNHKSRYHFTPDDF